VGSRDCRDSRARVVRRRAVVALVLVAQGFLVARGYWSDHREFAFQMFPESSTWRADVVRVTGDGQRIPIERPWAGYRWDELVTSRGLSHPSVRRHADAGLDNQLAFLDAALDWVAAHTPRDRETRYLEARVTAWHNDDPPHVLLLRSDPRRGVDGAAVDVAGRGAAGLAGDEGAGGRGWYGGVDT
jgi:hypothetical protein